MDPANTSTFSFRGVISGFLGWLLFFHAAFFMALALLKNVFCRSPWRIIAAIWILTLIWLLYSILRNRPDFGIGMILGVGAHLGLGVWVYSLPLNYAIVNYLINGKLLVPALFNAYIRNLCAG